MNYTYTGNLTAKSEFSCRFKTPEGKRNSIVANISTPNRTEPGFMNQQYNKFLSVGNYALYVDEGYENALLFDCGTVFGFQEYCLHVISRKPNMDKQVYDKIVAFAKSLGFDEKKLEPTLQDKCWTSV